MAKPIIGLINPERLREVLAYDPQTGIFRWRIRRGHRCAPVGSIARTHNSHGYIYMRIDNHLYKAHRLAWLLMTGSWPVDQIDHINGIRDDNRFVNLREASHILNGQNRHRVNSNNKHGFMGVSRTDSMNKFQARIRVDGKLIYLGRFATSEEAHAAYIAAKRKWHLGWIE